MNIKFYFALLFSFILPISSFSQVTVGGVGSLGGMCLNSSYTLPDIILGEQLSNGITTGTPGDNRFFYIDLPSNFSFSSGIGKVFAAPNGDITEPPTIEVSSNRAKISFRTNSYIPDDNVDQSSISVLNNGFYQFERAAVIYTPSEIKRSGFISGISVYVNQNPNYFSSTAKIPTTINLVSNLTVPSFFSSPVNFDDQLLSSTNVFNTIVESNKQIPQAYFDYEFPTPFYYDGTSNLELLIQSQIIGRWLPDEGSKVFRAHSTGFNQYSFNRSDASFTPVLFATSSFKPNIIFRFTSGNTSSLDILTISGLKATANTNSSGNVTYSPGNVALTGLSTLVNLQPNYSIGKISGFPESFCFDGLPTTFTGFPSGGSLSIIGTNYTGLVSTLTSNSFVIDPQKFTSSVSEQLSLVYNFPDLASIGCNFIYKDFTLNPKLPQLIFNGFNRAYPLSSNNIPLLISKPSNLTGAFSGFGVSSDTLYVKLAGVGKTKIFYNYFDNLTGCSSSVSDSTEIYDEKITFNFSPSSPLGQGKFCVDDFTQYKLSLFTISGAIFTPEQIIDLGNCPSSLSISSQPKNTRYINTFSGQNFGSGISFVSTVTSVDNLRLTPSGFLPGEYTLFYNNDALVNYDYTNSCNGSLLSQFGKMLNWQNKSQDIIVYDLPSKPILSSNVFAYCQGSVPNDLIQVQNPSSVSGSYFQWYKVVSSVSSPIIGATTAGININSLGIDNTTSIVGIPFRFSVRQNENGCWGDTLSFQVLIKSIPNAPTPFFKVGKQNNCVNDNISSFELSTFESSTPGVNISWFYDPACLNFASSNAVISNLGVNFGVANNIPQTKTFYVTQTFEGCRSNLLNSVSGVNSISVTFHPLPTWDLPNNNIIDRYCLGSTINSAFITVTGLNVSTVNGNGFVWYRDNALSSLIGSSLNVTSVLGSNLIGNAFNTSVSGLSIGQTDFYIKLKSDFNCISSNTKKYSVKVIEVPNAPVVLNAANGTLTGQQICFNTITNTGLTIDPIPNITYYSWYRDASLGSLIYTTSSINFVTSILGNTTVNVNFYVTQTNEICTSATAKMVNITIKPPLPKPLISPVTYYCTNRPIPSLTATGVPGSSIFWSSSKNSTLINSQTLAQSIRTSSEDTYYRAYQSFDNCVSDTSTVLLNVRQTPSIPIKFDNAYCSGETIKPLLVRANQNSGSFKWFASTDTLNSYLGPGITSIAGTSLFGIFNSSISGIATTTTGNVFTDNYATYINNGCSSDLVKITTAVFVIPDKPNSVSPDTICSNDQIPQLVAFGENLKWYTNTVSSSVSAGSSFDPISFGYVNTVQWANASTPPFQQFVYVTQTTNANTQVGNFSFNGCESAPKIDTISINALPPTPIVVNPFPYCYGDVLNDLTTNSVSPNAKIVWYKDEVDQVNFQDDSTTFVLSNKLSSTTDTNKVVRIYKVTQEFNNCKYPDNLATVVTVTINKIPKPSFISTIKNQYCNYDALIDVKVNLTSTGLISGFYSNSGASFGPTFSVSGLNSGSGYTTSGMGILLNPADASSVTSVNLVYQYRDSNGCANSVSSNFLINPKPVLQLNGLDTLYCNQKGSYALDLTPIDLRGQTVKGKGISPGGSGFLFQPSIAGDSTGPHTITYIYKDPITFCVDSIMKQTMVYPLPAPNFSISSFCLGDLITFSDLSTISSPMIITNQIWTFDTGTFSGASINNTYPAIGNFQMSLNVTTNKGCSNKIDSSFIVGPKPVANFEWIGICKDSETKFKSTSNVDAGSLDRFEWLIDGTKFNTTRDTLLRVFNQSGSRIVVLTVTTDRNCFDTISKSVSILPTYILSKTPLFENFDSNGNGGWFTEGRNSDWIYGTPNKTNLKGTTNAWYTGLSNTNYTSNQSSWMNSPCYDFSNLEKPMVVFDFSSFLYKDDGVVFQVTTNSGLAWNNVGEIGSGINWFNRSNIFGNPGEQKFFKNGWSQFDATNQWNEARHALDKFVGFKNVRFRFAFGSTPSGVSNTDLSYDGFAFDNFWIGERTKKTLVEQFVNTGNSTSIVNNVNYIINSRQNDVVAIQYHTSFPDVDKFNLSNPVDPGARVLFYGIQNSPRTVFDGNIFNLSSFKINPQILDLRSLGTPKFSISVEQTIVGNNLEIKGSLTADTTFGDSSLVLQIAVIERKLKNEIYESVLRKMLPNAAGTFISKNWIKGTDTTFSQVWPISGVDSVNQLQTVVFIQNQITKEVYQVGYTGNKVPYTKPIDTDISETIFADSNISIYPNPSNDQVNIEFLQGLNIQARVSLIDMYGKVLLDEKIGGDSRKVKILSVSNFASGVYNLSISSGKEVYNRKLTIIH